MDERQFTEIGMARGGASARGVRKASFWAIFNTEP